MFSQRHIAARAAGDAGPRTRLKVRARTESAPCPRDHHRAGTIQVIERSADLVGHSEAGRVEPLRLVERDRQDVAVARGQDGFKG